jgi:hypothetical protein
MGRTASRLHMSAQWWAADDSESYEELRSRIDAALLELREQGAR